MHQKNALLSLFLADKAATSSKRKKIWRFGRAVKEEALGAHLLLWAALSANLLRLLYCQPPYPSFSGPLTSNVIARQLGFFYDQRRTAPGLMRGFGAQILFSKMENRGKARIHLMYVLRFGSKFTWFILIFYG